MRRRIAFAAAFLALGAGISVLVAWRIAMTGAGSRDLGPIPQIEAGRLWDALDPSTIAGPSDTISGNRWGGPGVTLFVLERGPTIQQQLRSGILRPTSPERRDICQFGVPARCVEGWHFVSRRPSSSATATWWTLPFSPRSVPGLPVRPLWTGLAIDAVCCAAALALLAAGAARVRRRARLDRGLCPRCGYRLVPAAGTVTMTCSECGPSIRTAWLARPRQVLRWWMAACLAPPLVLAAMWLGVVVDWGWVRSDMGWSAAMASELAVVVIAVAAGLYVALLRSCGDRPALQRHLVAAGLAPPLAGACVTSAFIVAVRLLG